MSRGGGGTPGRAGAGTGRRIALAVALLAGLVFANSLTNGFARDDHLIIVRNPRVHSLDQLPELIRAPYWGPELRDRLYRPVAMVTYALNWAATPGAPASFHWVNVLLHGANTALLSMLLLALGAPAMAALLGGALFAVHPVHVEAVANVVGRADLLVGLFGLLACLAYVRLPGSRWRTGGLALAFALALGSKESGVVLPGLLVLLALFVERDFGSAWRRLRGEADLWLALMAVGALYLLARYLVLGQLGGPGAPFIEALSQAARIRTALRVSLEHVRLLFFPRHLSAEYGPAVILPVGPADPRWILGLLLSLGALALGVLAWPRSRWLSAAVFWFALTMLPVSNVLFPFGVWLAERILYLPSAALALLAVPLVDGLQAARPRARAAVGLALVLGLGLMALVTWQRSPTWRDHHTMIATLVRDHPESYFAQLAVADGLFEAGDVDSALSYYYRAFVIAPEVPPTGLGLSAALDAAGQQEEAAQVREAAWRRRRPSPELYADVRSAILRTQAN